MKKDKTRHDAKDEPKLDKTDMLALTIAFIQVLMPYLLISLGVIALIVFIITNFWIK